MKPTVLVIGAGIGGLTTAIALRQAGFDVEVFEREPELKEVGAGIALSPNAMRVLKRLGLMQQVVERGTAIKAATGSTWTGRELSRLPTDRADVPSVCLHRADLQEVLYSALPRECVHPGERFVDLTHDGGNVTARFAGGRTATGHALIGADGLRSNVRAALLGDGDPVYRGYQCSRGVCNLEAGDVLTETFGPGGVRMGVIPLGRRGAAWWFCVNEPEGTLDEPGTTKIKLSRLVENWHPPIPELLAATDPAEIIKGGIYDRLPVRRWSDKRCTLLGDAAHPTTPNMGQGGSMAIEDAVVVTRCLAAHSDLAIAFRVYEHLRRPRTARVTNISRYYGVMGQWENPVAASLRNAVLRLGTGKAATRSYLKFVSYDPYEVGLAGGLIEGIRLPISHD